MAKSMKKTPPKAKSKPEPKEIDFEDTMYPYRCTACGKGYLRQKQNFNMSPSPIYKGNNGYIHICKNCLKRLFDYFTDDIFDGNQDKAAELICQSTYTCFDETAWKNAKKVPPTRSRISAYFSKLNLGQTKGASYADTILFTRENQIENAQSIQEAEENPKYVTPIKVVKRFGVGFSDRDYETLQYEYDDWVAKYGEPEDKRQDELYKSNCYLKLQLQRSIQNGDNGVGALAKAYKEFINAATTELEDRKQKKEDSVVLEPIGVWIRDIEKYAPAELVKDRKLYKDDDGLGSYASRFIFRPLKNLLTGSKELDHEFNLSDKED